MTDFRDAYRALRASPIVSAVAILSLALGIGANTAIFSILDALMLRALPVKAPQQLAIVAFNEDRDSWTNPIWEQIRDRSSLFDGAAAWSSNRFNTAATGQTEFVNGLYASGRFFDVLGVPAILGRLLTDADAAIAELGFAGQQGQSMRVVENTPKVHNLVVCTLCSCYPWSVLGLPPMWYKSTAYRSRSVIDPRGVLGEFGLKLAEDVQVRVWDSTAELRYLVLPERPPGTEQLSESELAALVTRDSMIGTRNVSSPGSSSQTRRK